jgi:hypothetical protein
LSSSTHILPAEEGFYGAFTSDSRLFRRMIRVS